MHRSAPGRPRPRVPPRALWVLGLLLLAGCATGASRDNPFEGGGGSDVQIHVVNHNLQDVTVYALAPAIRQRLGRVVSNNAETFRMRWRHTSELRLELDFLAGRTCFSHPVMVSPGDIVEVILQPSLSRLDCR